LDRVLLLMVWKQLVYIHKLSGTLMLLFMISSSCPTTTTTTYLLGLPGCMQGAAGEPSGCVHPARHPQAVPVHGGCTPGEQEQEEVEEEEKEEELRLLLLLLVAGDGDSHRVCVHHQQSTLQTITVMLLAYCCK
jgi:hypothetical protein